MTLKTVNTEIKKALGRVKQAQTQLQSLLQNKTLIDEAKKYAEKQGKEVKKLINADVGLVKEFLERERKELERIQKRIPGEVAKLRKFVEGQKKELSGLLKAIQGKPVRKAATRTKKSTRAKAKKATVTATT